MAILSLSYLAGLPIAALFAFSGVGHFTKTPAFVGIMKGLPFPSLHPAVVYISGVMELIGAAGLVLAPSKELAWGLFLFVVAISAANVNMFVNDVPFGKIRFSYGFGGGHMYRALAQIVLLTWLFALSS